MDIALLVLAAELLKKNNVFSQSGAVSPDTSVSSAVTTPKDSAVVKVIEPIKLPSDTAEQIRRRVESGTFGL